MLAVRRALLVQITGLVVVGILLIALSHFFPVADILATVQGHVMRWGVWSAICYPLLYACCNVLLLPGGLLRIGGGVSFGLRGGIRIILVGRVGGAALSVFTSRWVGHPLRRPRFNRARTPDSRGPSSNPSKAWSA